MAPLIGESVHIFTHTLHDRPLAATGLLSYRYPSDISGWIMIGAIDDAGALREADRSLTRAGATISKLQRWDAAALRYVDIAP
jgi:hypothetical protein